MTLEKINLFIRSLLFSIYSLASIVVYSFVLTCLAIFPFRYRVVAIQAYVKVYFGILKKLCRINIVLEGLENIPKDRHGVILCKHQSTLETFYIPPMFDVPAMVAKRELSWIPFFGWGLAVCRPILIDRSNKSSAMQQILQQGKKWLDSGRWVMMFPEGTRIAPGKIGHYKLGGARLAAATGYPILPIAHNAGRAWPRRKFIKKPATIKIVFGPLIESEGQTPEVLLERTQRWIEDTMVRIDRA